MGEMLENLERELPPVPFLEKAEKPEDPMNQPKVWLSKLKFPKEKKQKKKKAKKQKK